MKVCSGTSIIESNSYTRWMVLQFLRPSTSLLEYHLYFEFVHYILILRVRLLNSSFLFRFGACSRIHRASYQARWKISFWVRFSILKLSILALDPTQFSRCTLIWVLCVLSSTSPLCSLTLFLDALKSFQYRYYYI